jgi:apolipoprotein N-acyltransferase
VTITRLAHAVVLAFGWRRALIAFVAGSASALAIAPFNAWPVLAVTFPVMVWLIDGSAAGRWSGPMTAAAAGWCFGFGYFLAGLYWIGYAFLVDAKTFGWLLPIAVAGLPAYLALYTALSLAAARLIWVRGPERILALAAALTAGEWLRGHLLSGFPWNTFGYALTEPLVLAQSVSLFGIWTLTFLCIAICASPAVLAEAEGVLRRITEQYFAIELTLDQMRELTHSDAADPLKSFGEACRAELLSLRATA